MKDNKPLEVFLLNVSALPVYFLFVEISSYICLFLNNSCDTFLQELKKYGVTTVVRVCEATYDATLVVKEGIQVLVSSGLQTFMTTNASNQTQCRFLPFNNTLLPSARPVVGKSGAMQQ